MVLIGWTGAILFALCAIPQAYKSYKDGHSNGIDNTFLWLWFLGESLSIIYATTLNAPSIMFNYLVNFTCLLVILKYKYLPRR